MPAGTNTAVVGRIVTGHGPRWAAWTDRGLVAVGTTRAGVVSSARAVGLPCAAGTGGAVAPTTVDWRYLPGGFRGRVLRACARIPAGQVMTYGELAAKAGSPGAARAVGTAMATNPVPVIIPCHRVVRADGALGAYSAGGTRAKARMLRAEGIALTNGRIG